MSRDKTPPAVTRPGFTFCFCPDSELLFEYIRSQLASTDQSWKIKQFWADEELTEGFWEALNWSGLLGDNLAVVLRRGEHLQTEDWNKLHPALGRFRSRVWPFFCLEREWSKGKPPVPAGLKKQKYWQVAQSKKWVWQSPGLNRDALRSRVQEWARQEGIAVDRKLLAVMVNILPLDGASLKNELDKLACLAGDRGELWTEDLAVLSFQADLDIFAFIRSLQHRGQEAQVWRQVLRNQAKGGSEALFSFLALLLREARILWQLSHGEGGKVWLPGQVKTQKMELARHIGQARMIQLWTLLLEAETGVKTGELSPDQAMEILVSRLTLLFSGSPGQA